VRTISTLQLILRIKYEARELGGIEKAAKEWFINQEILERVIDCKELPDYFFLASIGYKPASNGIKHRYERINQ
jgi:hypothetical protein